MKTRRFMFGVVGCLAVGFLLAGITGICRQKEGAVSAVEPTGQAVVTEEGLRSEPTALDAAVRRLDEELVGTMATVSDEKERLYTVLDQSERSMAGGGVFRKTLLQEKAGARVLLREDVLELDPQTRRFVARSQTTMAADQILVQVHSNVDEEQFQALNHRFNTSVLRSVDGGRTFVIQLSSVTLDGVQQAMDAYRKAVAEVAYAEPDYVRVLSRVPNDLMYGELWGMDKISAPDAWDMVTGSDQAVVAVIDTGMYMTHRDLVDNLWTNSREIPGDGVDNDGNGYVDDIHGWDFVSDDNSPDDMDGHGTHCAGVVGAVGNNANQVVGVCWDASLMILRAGTSSGLFDSDIVDSIRYAAKNGAKVLSNSYGGAGFSQTIYDAITYANEQGCIFVAAAGNDATDNDAVPVYPASYDLPNVVAVAATDQSDQLAEFSNYGAESVDLAAPGVGIVSTYLNGGTASLDGTSMACPHVAGALTLLMSAQSNASPAEAKAILMSSLDDVPALSGKVVSGGRLNVNKLVLNTLDADKDGMPDTWEETYGLDPNDPSDALLDLDGDLLVNVLEFQNGCDPMLVDSDGDSLRDSWEVMFETNPRNTHGELPRLQYLAINTSIRDAYDVAVQGEYAYVADGVNGLRIVDISDPEHSEVRGTYPTGGSAEGIAVAGYYAYVADSQNGFQVVNISNPDAPTGVSGLEENCVNVQLDGSYAYLACGTNDLVVVNVSDPLNPSVEGAYRKSWISVNDVQVTNGVCYLAMDGQLGKLDVSSPRNPSDYQGTALLSASGATPSQSIFCNGSQLFVAQDNYALAIYTTGLDLVSRWEGAKAARDVWENNDLVYLADGAGGLVVLDVSNPSSIVKYDEYANVFAEGVCFQDGYTYVAGRSTGLHIFKSSRDFDKDGLYDQWEIDNFGSIEAQSWTNDFDGDGINNWGEYLLGLDTRNTDQDGDDLIDGYHEVLLDYYLPETNINYLSDMRTDDSDGDGLSDAYETSVDASRGNLYYTYPTSADTDADGMPDAWEIANQLDPTVDNAADDEEPDGVTNLDEYLNGTNPRDGDSDADGMPDAWEIENQLNPALNDASMDPDNDSFGAHLYSNLIEYQNGTNPQNPDSDGDGMLDGWEDFYRLDPLDETDAVLDPDGDDLSNLGEHNNQTDPYAVDSDLDRMWDGWEVMYAFDPNDPADPNPLGDPDGDSLGNLEEFEWKDNLHFPSNAVSTNPKNPDTDGDGLLDGFEIVADGSIMTNQGVVITNLFVTDPNRADTDGDGMEDGWELVNRLDPTIDDSDRDDDGDNLSNYEEFLNGSSPSNADTDGDSFRDDWEMSWGTLATNAADPVVIDDDATNDPVAQDPKESDPLEDGSLLHPFDAIQEGVDAAVSGFTVLVLPGEYYGSGNRAIDLGEKQLHILSEQGAALTSVKSHGLAAGFIFSGGQDTNTVLRGFTIQTSFLGVDCSDGDCGEEHGIICADASSPLIEDCVVQFCRADAIHCSFGSSPWIVNTVIQNIYEGAAVRAVGGSAPVLMDCVIDYAAGGVVASDCEGLEILNTRISRTANRLGVGRAISLMNVDAAQIVGCTISACQGAVMTMNSSPVIDRCRMTDNYAPDYYDLNGVIYTATTNIAVLAAATDGMEDITDSDENGGAVVILDDSVPMIQNCVIAENRTWAIDPGVPNEVELPSYGLGGAVYVGANCYASNINCTLVNNIAMTRGGGITTYGNFVEFIRNAIIWGNTCEDAWYDDAGWHASGNQVFNSLHCREGSSHFDPWYCTISDGFGFVGDRYNIEQDPMFVGSGYELMTNSPCVDSGTAFSAPLYDLIQTARPLDGNGDADARYDMGAYEFNPAVSVSNDADSDGLDNDLELTLGTDPNNDDSDGDGMLDGWEYGYGLLPLNSLDAEDDPDGDGLNNLMEHNRGTDPTVADTDMDGLSDGDEVFIHGTDPLVADSDGDGIADGWEFDNGLNPLNPDVSGDSDGDGLSDYEEFLLGSDPSSVDSDGDSFSDQWEYDNGTSLTNAIDPVIVDDDHPDDPQAFDPLFSNPDEDGSVYAPFDAIQEGIDHASSGMTVLVTNGYYIGAGNMNIDMNGKDLRIIAMNGPSVTTIDGDGLGAGFICQNGESTNALIRGFTIKSPGGGCGDGDCGYEYGIVCRDVASPVIEDCIITNCSLAGVQCESGATPILTNLEITGCGDGIVAFEATPRIIDCRIVNIDHWTDDRRSRELASGYGISSVNSSSLIVFGSIVSNCSGRGVSVVGDPAFSMNESVVQDNHGGMVLNSTKAEVGRSVIRGNVAPDYFLIDAYAYYRNSLIAVEAANTNLYTDITDEDENGAGILMLNESSLLLQNSLVAENEAVAMDPAFNPDIPDSVPEYGLGGGLYIGAGCVATNVNCTFVGNIARRGGGISSHGTESDYVGNTILWDNEAYDLVLDSFFVTNEVETGSVGGEATISFVETEIFYSESIAQSNFYSLHCRHGAFAVWYSDVENGSSYMNPYKYVVEVDPLFDANYKLTMASSCIDTGTTYYAVGQAVPSVDLAGVPRPLDGDTNGVARVDLGAYEFVHAAADTDADGLLDQVEIDAGTDPLVADARADLDGDGLQNIYELRYGLDVGTNDADGDLDGDGLSNVQEFTLGTNPTLGDSDGDKSLDGEEELAGTNPLNASSFFCVQSVQSSAAGGCSVVFETAYNRWYTVYTCAEIGGDWSVLKSGIPGVGEAVSISDTTHQEHRFYKVEVSK